MELKIFENPTKENLVGNLFKVIKAGEIVAQYVIDISGGTSTLQKDITSAGKALAGLEKQTRGLANGGGGVYNGGEGAW